MRVRLLGPVELVDDEGAKPISAAKRRVVLAALATELNHVVSASRLIDIVWDYEPPSQARTALHVHISALRKLLNSDMMLETRSGGYTLLADRASVDAFVFDEMVASVKDADDATAAGVLQSALDLWRGPALANVPSRELQATVAAQLEQRRLTALGVYADHLIKLGRVSEVLRNLEEAAISNPLCEPLIQRLIRALQLTGRQAEALTVYERTRRQLADTLGVDPSRQLRQAFDAVLQDQKPSKVGVRPTSEETESPLRQHQLQSGRPVQLFMAVSRFAGRTEQLAWMDRVTASPLGSPPVLVVGAAGVGKTALVMQWAHHATDRFPDGQVFVNLHGFDDADPCSTETALNTILRSLGVPKGSMPPDVESQATLYRRLIATRRMLVVLDNTRDVDQVRSLLPDGSSSVAVITSRNRLDGLVVHDGAVTLPLDVMSEEESLLVLNKAIGTDLVRSDLTSARRLTELCGRLPLALRIVAAHVAARPECGLRPIVGELSDEQQRLAGLSTFDGEISIEASLACSYRSLPTAAARMFALLAEHPGTDIDNLAATALAGISLADSKRALANLVAVHLLSRTGSRYGAHDLVRLFACDVANSQLSQEERRAAAARLLYYYVAATGDARRAVTKSKREFQQLPADLAPVATPAFLSSQAAISWFIQEEPTIRALVTSAQRVGHSSGAWLLAGNASALYMWQGSASHALATATAAVTAARDVGDPFGLLLAVRSLGVAYTDASQLAEARKTFAEARQIASTLPDPNIIETRGNRIGLLRALAFSEPEDIVLDDDLVANSEVPESVDPFLAVMRQWFLAVARLRIGQLDGTLQLVDDAMEMAERNAVNSVAHQLRYARGCVLAGLEQFDAAIVDLRKALTLAVAVGDERIQASCLEVLGDTVCKLGRADEAQSYLRDAADLYDRLGSSAGDQLRARIDTLTAPHVAD